MTTTTSKTNKELLERDVALGVLRTTLHQLDRRLGLGDSGMLDVARRLAIIFEGEGTGYDKALDQAVDGWFALPLVDKNEGAGVEAVEEALDLLLECDGQPIDEAEMAIVRARLVKPTTEKI
jgi:hypothetical protein